MTDSVSNARLFWQLVDDCLIHLYGWAPDEAHARVQRSHGKLTKAAIAQDIVYHSQPLHVANDIANSMEPISDEQVRAYEVLQARRGMHLIAMADRSVAGTPAGLTRGEHRRRMRG